MSRLVRHDAQGPAEVKLGGESKWICQCGLSKNKPFCDGSHKQTLDELPGKLYKYENGKRKEVKE